MKFSKIFFITFVVTVLLVFQLPFKGSVTVGERLKNSYAEFSVKDFFNKKYQRDYESYKDMNFGLRNVFIRLKNQVYNFLNFGYFNSSFNRNIEKGEDGFLFQKSFINIYFQPIEGKKHLKENFLLLDEIVKKLNQLGIKFIFVIEPDKASTLAEHWPYKWKLQRRYNQDYIQWNDTIEQECKRYNLTCLDLIKTFRSKKNENFSNYFVKGGEHWTMVGAGEAASQMLKIIDNTFDERIIDNRKLKFTPFAMHAENDLISLLNLFSSKKEKEYPYFEYEYSPDPFKIKKNIFLYGDSYTDQLKDALLSTGIIERDHLEQNSNKTLNEKEWLDKLCKDQILIFSYTLPNILSSRLMNDAKGLLQAINRVYSFGSGVYQLNSNEFGLSSQSSIFIMSRGETSCTISFNISEIKKYVKRIQIKNSNTNDSFIISNLNKNSNFSVEIPLEKNRINKISIIIPEANPLIVYSQPVLRDIGLIGRNFTVNF